MQLDLRSRRLTSVDFPTPAQATICNDVRRMSRIVPPGGAASRYEIKRAFAVSDDVIIAHVARYALDPEGHPIEPSSNTSGAFSEMALYVLVRRDGTWWLAAGQNTSIRPGGAV